MKKILYPQLAGAMAPASCRKSDEIPIQAKTEITTFSLVVEGSQTRTTSPVTPVRYVMEVWSEDGSTAENVFGTGDATTNHKEVTTDRIIVALDKTKAYTCLFWADFDTNNTAGSFNAASLKAISLNTGKSVTEAYFSKVAVAKGKSPAVAVALKRAVAKITLTETGTVKTSDNLALKLSNTYPTFSVLDGEASGTATKWTKTINPSVNTGTIATLYFFAKAEKVLSDLKFTYTGAAEKTISNISVQQNYATSIKGEFRNLSGATFTITADNEWISPDNDVEFGEKLKVGSFYYKDKSFSSTYIGNAQNPCIGIVFVVNADGKTGKIVGLDEPIANWDGGTNAAGKLAWGPTGVVTNAIDEMNGAANMAAIKGISNWATSYRAFAWAESKNPSVAGINWYLPATKELRQLYAAMSGLKWVASGAVATEINDWGSTAMMPNHASYSAARTTFNGLFTTAGGTAMDLSTALYYWSSTQEGVGGAWFVRFSDGVAYGGYKGNLNSFRVISAF